MAMEEVMVVMVAMEVVVEDMGVATDMEDMVVVMEDMAMGGALEVGKDMDGVLEVDMGDMDIMAKEV